MLAKIAYFLILGKPLVFYLGIFTLASLLSTAAIGFLNMKGIHKIPLKWHFRMAGITVASALLHGVLAISAYF
ncbi:MAG: hypothetical protein PHX98_03075 [Candidatus Moranbacteria bacterium]|jgi:MFS superfamily sulfate permease-like transporter|nr:hypothetical protein [Candidatus Moranbacteria bacterium]